MELLKSKFWYFQRKYDTVNKNRRKWYGDNATMVTVTYPWSDRGGNHNNAAIAGVFNYNNAHGGVYDNVSFRQVQDYKRKCFLQSLFKIQRKEDE